MENRGSAFLDFFRGTDIEILPKSLPIHSGAIILYLDGLVRHLNIDLGRIGIISIINQFADELDALGIESFSDRDQMAFIDRNRKVFHLLIPFVSFLLLIHRL